MGASQISVSESDFFGAPYIYYFIIRLIILLICVILCNGGGEVGGNLVVVGLETSTCFS